MKILVSTFAIAVALALSGMAYAAEDKWAAETEADCLKVGGVWIADAKDCQAPGGQAVEKELQERVSSNGKPGRSTAPMAQAKRPSQRELRRPSVSGNHSNRGG